MEYNIAAIPTVYNGRQYRSRLEAKWAAFFHAMKWEAEYEPFDLGSWSPDFLLRVICERYLVEIKPIEEFSDEVSEKMLTAALKKSISAEHAPSLLMLGISPFYENSSRSVQIGWFNEFSEGNFLGWGPCYVSYFRSSAEPVFNSFISCSNEAQSPTVFGYKEYTMSLWANATNQVQWQARQK